jgi:hypothetical protein
MADDQRSRHLALYRRAQELGYVNFEQLCRKKKLRGSTLYRILRAGGSVMPRASTIQTFAEALNWDVPVLLELIRTARGEEAKTSLPAAVPPKVPERVGVKGTTITILVPPEIPAGTPPWAVCVLKSILSQGGHIPKSREAATHAALAFLNDLMGKHMATPEA